MISRADIDDAVEGYIRAMLESAADAVRRQRVPSFGAGDIPKNALLSMRRDVTAFVKKNDLLVRRSMVGSPGRLVPMLDFAGWMGVGYDFAIVRNEYDPSGKEFLFRDVGWHPYDIAAKLDEAAWAFPRTKLYVGDENSPEPGRLYFWGT
jgi:hypothetical protein